MTTGKRGHERLLVSAAAQGSARAKEEAEKGLEPLLVPGGTSWGTGDPDFPSEAFERWERNLSPSEQWRFHALWMSVRALEAILEQIERGNYLQALCWASSFVRPMSVSPGRPTKVTDNQLQSLASIEWQKEPTLSKRKVAERLKRATGLSAERIRKRIRR